MGGRASLIMVLGFAIIFGYLNLNMASLSSRAVENMVGYYDISASRNVANAGANVGVAKLFRDTVHNQGVIASQSFSGGRFSGSSYTVTFQAQSDSTMLLRSISSYPTIFKTLTGTSLTLNDTVEVVFDGRRDPAFCYWGWLTNTENGVNFITGDTIDGRAHSNGNINVTGAPVFKRKVTTSGVFSPACSTARNPTNNKMITLGGSEQGIARREFPTDLSQLEAHANNSVSTRNQELYVELKKGVGGSDDNGYVLIRSAPTSGPTQGPGSFTGAVIDSLPLTGIRADYVIFSQNDIHLMGDLDGRLSVSSNSNIIVEGNIKYEVNPKIDRTSNDVLGIVAKNNVEVSRAFDRVDVTIQGSIFCLNGSFKAQDFNSRGPEGYLNILGSVTQNVRGPVGNFNTDRWGNPVLANGFLKNYKFDDRMDNQDFYPPYFPGTTIRTLRITDWRESVRSPEFF